MTRTVGIGIQSFEKVVTNHCFYVDKTHFIKEWWENHDDVTLIARPRRFGKTLNMNMLECFFSLKYKNKGQIFEGLSIWKEEKYRQIQGTFPVISLSFANIKENEFERAKKRIGQLISEVYLDYYFLLDSEKLLPLEKTMIQKNMENPDPVTALYQLSRYLFNSTFKTNPYLDRALMTGITRVSKESIFSDLNNLTVITTTSDAYADCFGFTQKEVWEALNEYDLSENMDKVKAWYDGFIFGRHEDIYNPWSIINYLKTQRAS